MEKYIYKPLNSLSSPTETLNELILVPKIKQKSEEWLELRKKLFTASSISSIVPTVMVEKYWKKITPIEFHTLLNSEYCNPYQTPYDFYNKIINGSKFVGNNATRFGERYEDVAEELYKRINNVKVFHFGTIISHKFPWLGASPDGIDSNGIMIEIKSPFSREIEQGFIPINYYIQMQVQMYCCCLLETNYIEIKVKEYDSIVDYLNKKPESFYLNGMAITFFDKDKISYKYCFDSSIDNFETCIQETESILNIKYFYVTNYQIKKINFEPEFCEQLISLLKVSQKLIDDLRNGKKQLKDIPGYSGFI